MNGSLLYLIASKLDIQLSVGICVRFQSNPKQSHLHVVKRILRYLEGTTNLGLWYKKGTFCDVTIYCDANFTADRAKRKSTSGWCCFIKKYLITRSNRKQNTIALSTAKAKYVFATNCYA